MGNRLLQEARNFVELAKQTGSTNEETIQRAKNALSSAYANSTFAEQEQLHQLQNELDTLNSQK